MSTPDAEVRAIIMRELRNAGGRVPATTLVERVVDALRVDEKQVHRALDALGMVASSATSEEESVANKASKLKPEELRKSLLTLVQANEQPISLDEVFEYFVDELNKEQTTKNSIVAAVETLSDTVTYDREARTLALVPKVTAMTTQQAAIAGPMARRIGTRYLDCTLDGEQIAAMHELRTKLDAQIDELTLEAEGHAQMATNAKKRIKELANQTRGISKDIRENLTRRNVECEERREIDQRVGPTQGREIAVTYRLDTNTPVDWRELRGDERQGHLFDVPEAEPEVAELPPRKSKKKREENSEIAEELA